MKRHRSAVGPPRRRAEYLRIDFIVAFDPACSVTFAPRRQTVTALVGAVPVGSAHPIVVQSMTNTDTADAVGDGGAGRRARAGRLAARARHGEQRRGGGGRSGDRRAPRRRRLRRPDRRRLSLQRPSAARASIPTARARSPSIASTRATSAESGATRTFGRSCRSPSTTTSRCASA